MTQGLVDSLIYRFFSSLTYRLRVLLDRLLPLDLDQGNGNQDDFDQTFEVVSQGRHQRLKLILDRSAIACPLVQPGNRHNPNPNTAFPETASTCQNLSPPTAVDTDDPLLPTHQSSELLNSPVAPASSNSLPLNLSSIVFPHLVGAVVQFG